LYKGVGVLEKKFWHAVLRFLIVAVVIIPLVVALYYVLPLIYPFLIGIVFALIFNPFVNMLEKRAKVPRWLSVTIAILLLLAILITIIVLVVIEIASEITNLQEKLPLFIADYITQVQEFIFYDLVAFYDQFTAFYSSLDPEVRKNIEQQVQSFSDKLVELVQGTITNLFEGIVAFLGAVPTIATAFIISLLASFFISKDWPRLRHKFIELIPDQVHRSGGAVLSDLRKALFGFIKAQLTLISITFILVLLGFIILDIEYGLTLAIVIALVDLLPYLGTGLVFVPWIVYLFISADYSMVIGLSILYAVVVIQRQMMEPKILGTNVGLDPLLTLVALFVGFQLFSFIGLIIGPVFMVIVGALHRAGVFRDLWAFIRGA
jgi:sporulation integral membrane protein YtvI